MKDLINYKGVEQGRPNPNPMSAKLHQFATKIAVGDSFAQKVWSNMGVKNWPR